MDLAVLAEEDLMFVPVIYGSVRSARQGIRGARFVVRALERRGHDSPLVDPLEYRLPLLDRMYKEYEEGQAPELLQRLAAMYARADAFVFVCGEYNHGVPPALKNQIDHFLETWFWRPAGIACYSAGPFGGVRAAVQLRTILGEVGLITVPSMFAMPGVGRAFDEEGSPSDDAWERRIGKFLDELEWYAEALKAQRESKGVPYS
jgi:NAD(P)H-dependent FMN reductase